MSINSIKHDSEASFKLEDLNVLTIEDHKLSTKQAKTQMVTSWEGKIGLKLAMITLFFTTWSSETVYFSTWRKLGDPRIKQNKWI